MGPGAIFALLMKVWEWRKLLSFGNGLGLLSGALAFFSTPIGRLVGAGVLGVGMYFTGHILGGHSARVECDARVDQMIAESKAAAEARDKQIKEAATKFVEKSTKELTTLNADLEKKVKAYESGIPKSKGGNSCVLGPNDIKRLRNL